MAASNSYTIRKRFPNGKFRLTPKSEVGFQPGLIDADPRTAAKTIKVACTMKVNATAAAAGGLGTKRANLFAGLFLRLSTGPNTGRESDRDKTYDWNSFTEIEQALNVEVGRLVAGYSDTTDGLAQALVVGANYLNFTFEVPTGSVQQIAPRQGLFGMGPSQLKTADLKVKMGADPLKDADATLSIEYIDVEFGPGEEEQTNGDQWCDAPALVTRKGTNTQEYVEFDDGAYIAAFDRNAALTANTFTAVTVAVDDYTYLADPATPNDGYREWVATPGVGTVEDLSGKATPFYQIGPTRLKNVRTGKLKIRQRKSNTGTVVQFDLIAFGFNPRTTAKVKEAVKLMADQLEVGQELKAIAVNVLESSVETESRHNWMLGFRTFRPEERQFGLYAGWKCRRGGEPEIDIPTPRLMRAAYAYSEAKSNPNPTEAAAGMEEVIRTLADEVPGAAPFGRGYKGGTTEVYEEVERRLINFVNAWNARQAK